MRPNYYLPRPAGGSYVKTILEVVDRVDGWRVPQLQCSRGAEWIAQPIWKLLEDVGHSESDCERAWPLLTTRKLSMGIAFQSYPNGQLLLLLLCIIVANIYIYTYVHISL